MAGACGKRGLWPVGLSVCVLGKKNSNEGEQGLETGLNLLITALLLVLMAYMPTVLCFVFASVGLLQGFIFMSLHLGIHWGMM